MLEKSLHEGKSLTELDAANFAGALTAAADTAKRREKYFWALSLLWVGVIFGVALFFVFQMVRFRERQDFSDRQVALQLQRIVDLNKTYNALQGSVERMQLNLYDSLPEGGKKKYALAVQQAQIERKELTGSEKEILSRLRKNPVGGTVENLYVEATAALDGETPDLSSAVEKLIVATSQDPRYEPAQAALGRAYQVLGRYEEADKPLEKALELTPDAPNYAAHCWTLVRIGQAEGGVKDCTKAIQVDDRYWVAYSYRGFAYYQLKKDKEAESDWKKAASLRDNPRPSLENLGLIYLRRADWKQALDNAAKLNTLDSNGSWNWLFLSIAADRLGRRDQADAAQAQWMKLHTPGDYDDLKYFLPRELQTYILGGPKETSRFPIVRP